jgi:TonB family protein
MQAISLGFVMPDAPNLPLNSMIPLEFIGRNEAGQTTLSQRSGYQFIMDGMGASSDLSRPENYANREIVAQIRDVLVAHERDWHTSGEPVESYPGANAQAEAVQKMVNQAMSRTHVLVAVLRHVPPPAVASSATTQTTLYHVGGDVTPPQLIYTVDPQFSDEARRAKLPKGWLALVVVSLVADAQGNPRLVIVRHRGMGLDEKALEAVRQYRFKPATLHGEPVPAEVNIEVNFKVY